MADTTAQAYIAIFNNCLSEKDYFIVGQQICISKSGHPLSELELESEQVAQACREILAGYGVPIFTSWSAFEAERGPATVEAFRKNAKIVQPRS